MHEKKVFSHDEAIEKITTLHYNEMQMVTSAIYVPKLRDVISGHISAFIDKSSTSKNRNFIGLTHLVVGTRVINNGQLIIRSIERSADESHKEAAKAQIECALSIAGMLLHSIEEDLQEGINPTRKIADVGGKLKYLNFHESLRTDLYKSTETISDACATVYRAMMKFIRKNVEFSTSETFALLMKGDYDIDKINEQELELSESEFQALRQRFIDAHHNELDRLCVACGVDDINEVMTNWMDIYALRGKFEAIKRCRNDFVLHNTNLVRKAVCQQLKGSFRYLDSAARQEKIDNYFASSITMLLDKIYKYNPEYSFTTFAQKYLEQECKSCLANDDLIKLPAFFANKQKEVLQAGITMVDGKEFFDEDRALKAMRAKYPTTHWTSDIIADVRFKNSKSTVTMHSDDDDESGSGLEMVLADDNANPERDADYSKWAQFVVEVIAKLPDMERKNAISKMGISQSQFDALSVGVDDNYSRSSQHSIIIENLLNMPTPKLDLF